MTLADYGFEKIEFYVSGKNRKAGLKKKTRYTWYDKNNMAVAGVIVERWDDGWNSCHNLYVSDDYRGNGLSHQLVEFVKMIGVTHLSVAPDNSIAISLYRKHGFLFTGEKEGPLLRMEYRSYADVVQWQHGEAAREKFEVNNKEDLCAAVWECINTYMECNLNPKLAVKAWNRRADNE